MSVERVLDPTPAQLPARPPPATRSVREERSLVLFLGLLAAALFLLFQQGTIANSDGQAVFDLTRSLVEDHDLTIDEELGSQGRGGSYFSHFGIGLSVVGVVPYVAAYPVARLAGHDYFVYEFAASSTMPLICALLVVLLYLLARRLAASIRASLLVAGGSVAGTYVLAYTKEYYSEPLAAAFLVLAIERTLAKAPRQACVALVLAFLCRPEVVAVTPVFLLAFWYDGGFRSLRKAVPVVAAGGGLVLVYNAVRFGGPLDVGYGTETFTSWHFGRL